jgi:uncharacterized protein DUF3568
MAEIATRWSVIGAITVVLLGAQGCAAGLTLFGAGAGVSGGSGVSYTLDSIAYKTFTTPVEDLQGATMNTLKRMDIAIKENKPSESGGGRRIKAVAGDRDIEIELDRLTTKVSRMRVNAKQGWLLRDRATATEIIVQTAQTLEDHPPRANRTMRTAAHDAQK